MSDVPSELPVPASPRPLSGAGTALQLADVGELVAAVPALLGFHPRESLVLIGLGGPSGCRVLLTLRVDLPPPADVEEVCHAAVHAVGRARPSAAVVVVVGGVGPGSGGAPCGAGSGGRRDGGDAARSPARGAPPRQDVADAVVEALDRRGIAAHTVAWVAETSTGAAWSCYPGQGCGCAGSLPDPRCSAAAAAATANGTVIYSSREELARQVEPVPGSPPGAQAAGGLPGRPAQSRRTARREVGRPDRRAPDGRAGLARHFAALEAALAEARAGTLRVDPRRAAELAASLGKAEVRDIALAACDGPTAPAAEQLWAVLARHCPGPEAAEPAALLAVSALLRGDGALANVALDRARQACPDHRLAGVLRISLEVGLGPEEIRAWVRLPARLRREAAGW